MTLPPLRTHPINVDQAFRLSVLDQSPIAEGSSAGQALRNSVELAKLAERAGYERFWVAEHHGTPSLACASPEVLIGAIAAATDRIRVGSGGIMLPHYSPLKVNENFSMLAEMFPDRIDLGIGRAAGTSPAISFALQRDRRQRLPDDFKDQLTELLGYLSDNLDENPFPQIARALPKRQHPQPFLLGSSPQSAIWAAELGLPYVFADFINADGAQIVSYYRQAFRPSVWGDRPRVIVASWAVCADSDEEAMHLSASTRMLMTLLHRGQLIPVPSVDKALSFLRSEHLPVDTMPPGRRLLTGSPHTLRARLEDLSTEYGGPDEIALVNILHDHGARLRSYQLIAEACGLLPSFSEHPQLPSPARLSVPALC